MATSDELPHYLVQRVREALAHDPRTGELEVKVKIYGQRVVLTGVVTTQERRDAVTEIVQRELPDHDVVNETSVATMEEPEGVERLT